MTTARVWNDAKRVSFLFSYGLYGEPSQKEKKEHSKKHLYDGYALGGLGGQGETKVLDPFDLQRNCPKSAVSYGIREIGCGRDARTYVMLGKRPQRVLPTSEELSGGIGAIDYVE